MRDHHRRPRLEGPYFGGEGSIYARMGRVLDYTAQRHCPGWTINVKPVEPEPIRGVRRDARFVVNTQKLDLWCRTIVEAPVGDRICLIDSDTFVVNGIDDVWDRDFDLAYTVRDYIIPFNSGVMFVRVTPQTKAFMQRWRDENAAMYGDVSCHMKWREKYGGMTQASLGRLLERDDHGLNLLTLPCGEWNCEDSCWGDFDPARTRIVHVKSGLRRLIFQGDVGAPQYPWWTSENLMPLARRWHALERDAKKAEEYAAIRSWFGAVPTTALDFGARFNETIAASVGAAEAEEVFA
ncbi:MAG TPA: hypothetical protein VHG93_01960 [Longimicrobium sp.]|nr:hypothetical protein [Longimicrobium sp.]